MRIKWVDDGQTHGRFFGRFHRAHYANGWSLNVARDAERATWRIWDSSHGPFATMRQVNAAVRAIESGNGCTCRYCGNREQMAAKKRTP